MGDPGGMGPKDLRASRTHGHWASRTRATRTQGPMGDPGGTIYIYIYVQRERERERKKEI